MLVRVGFNEVVLGCVIASVRAKKRQRLGSERRSADPIKGSKLCVAGMWGGVYRDEAKRVCVLSEHCALISDRFIRFASLFFCLRRCTR